MMAKEHTKFVGGNKEEFDKGNAKSLIPGCVGNGIQERVAEEIWEKMTKFASYAFNRSHAACYAWIAYLTAYMSCHWPAEFYAAMLNAFIENSDKMKSYLGQANARDIHLLLPDIQKSVEHFSTQEGSILFGFQGINGLKAMAVCIVDERNQNGPYRDLQDLYERLANKDEKLNKKCIEGLVYSGALREFSDNKAALLEQYNLIEENFKAGATDRALNQISMFAEAETKIPLPIVQPLSAEFLLGKEQETLGMYVSSHPMDLYVDRVRNSKDLTALENIAEIDQPRNSIKTMALIKGIRHFYTKAGKEMVSFTAETRFASMPCIIFPDRVESCRPLLEENTVCGIDGSLVKDSRNDDMQISVKTLMMPALMETAVTTQILATVRNRAEQDEVIDFVRHHPGETKVVLVAGGREYPLKIKVALSDESKNFFAQFSS